MFTDTPSARLFRALLLAVMMATLAHMFLAAARVFFPDYAPWWFLPGVVLVSLEAAGSTWLRERLELRGQDRLVFHLIEFAVLVLCLRLLTLARLSFSQFRATMAEWAWDPTLVFDLEFVVLLVLLLFLWQAASGSAGDLALLEVRQTDFDPEGRLYRGEWARGDVRAARARLVGRFFWGGALLLVFVALPRVAFLSQGNLAPVPASTLLAAVGYFIAGLALLSQAHLAVMQREWLGQGERVDKEVVSRWPWLSLATIAAVAAVVAFLPTGYTGGVLELLQAVIALFGFVISFIGVLIATLITLPFLIILALLRNESPLAQAPRLMPPPELAPAPSNDLSWFEAFRMVLFWSLVFAAIGYVLREYLRTHSLWLDDLRRLALLDRLIPWLTALWHALRRQGGAVAQAVTGGVRAIVPRRPAGVAGSGRWPRLRLRRLSPRGQVQYYYLSHLRRAAQAGYPRHPAQTPNEYATDLTPHLDHQAVDWQRLTEAFVHARYNPDPLSDTEVKSARDAWQRLKRALQALRRQR